MEIHQIGSLAVLAGAAALALQGFMAQREQAAMRTRWPVLNGVVTQARPEVLTDSEGTSWNLHLNAQTPDGDVGVSLIANSQAEHEAQIAAYPNGAPVRLRRDPKSGVVYVEGHLPKLGAAWLYAAALGLMVLGVAAWFDALGWLFPAQAN